MCSKAWLAARVSLRLARLPRTASSAQCSRRLRSTRTAVPVLLAHAEVTKNIKYFSMGPNINYVCTCCVQISGCINVSANGVVDSLRTLPRIQQLSLARLPLTSLTPAHLLEATASLWLETLDLTNCVQLDAGWFLYSFSCFLFVHWDAFQCCWMKVLCITTGTICVIRKMAWAKSMQEAGAAASVARR
jgi:hypothetical protein